MLVDTTFILPPGLFAAFGMLFQIRGAQLVYRFAESRLLAFSQGIVTIEDARAVLQGLFPGLFDSKHPVLTDREELFLARDPVGQDKGFLAARVDPATKSGQYLIPENLPVAPIVRVDQTVYIALR